MTEQQMLELAEQYYDQGRYPDALDICNKLIRGGKMENPCKVHTLSAKGLLGPSFVLSDESLKETFTNQAYKAYITAESALEQLRVRREIAEAIVQWAKPALRKAVDEFRFKPSQDTVRTLWKALNPASYSLFFQETVWPSVLMNNPHKVTEEDIQKANALYGPMPDDIPEGELISIVLKDGVKTVMSATKHVLSVNNAGSADSLNAVIDFVWEKLYLCWLLIDNTIPKENDKKRVPPILLFDCLQTKISLLRLILDAKVFPEGKDYSVFQEQDIRDRAIKEFQETNERLKEIYPDYKPYETPAAEPVGHFSSKSSLGGCYVATAVYGSYDCPEVWTLRRFRDNTLAGTWYGRAFIRTYYAVSPTLVRWFGHTAWFKNMWRGRLDKLVDALRKQGVESTPYQDRNW